MFSKGSRQRPAYFSVHAHHKISSVHQRPKEFKERLAWDKDYEQRRHAYNIERRASGLKDEAPTREAAEALLVQLKPLADKHNIPLEIGEAFNL